MSNRAVAVTSRASDAGALAPTPGSPASATRHHAARGASLALGALLLVGCRSDSITTPTQPTVCGDEIGCRSTQSDPVGPLVFAALDDARERLVPSLDDAAARETLASALSALRASLQANRSVEARTRLAMALVHLDRLRVVIPGTSPLDLPDLAAIRLALVPVSNALGVTAS